MRNSGESMKNNGRGFQNIKSACPRISDAKLNVGVFVGPQIREILLLFFTFNSKSNRAESLSEYNKNVS